MAFSAESLGGQGTFIEALVANIEQTFSMSGICREGHSLGRKNGSGQTYFYNKFILPRGMKQKNDRVRRGPGSRSLAGLLAPPTPPPPPPLRPGMDQKAALGATNRETISRTNSRKRHTQNDSPK